MEENLWNDLPGVVAVLKIISNKMIYLQKQNITMSDAYGVWLELEFLLKKIENCSFAAYMLEKLIYRRDQMKIVDNDVMLAAMFLDLRFNRLLSKNQKERAIKHIQYLHEKIQQKKHLEIPVPSPIQRTVSSDDPNVLEQILRNMESAERNLPVEVTADRSLNKEIEQYGEIERANARTNVITEWQARKYDFPILYELAMVVLAVSPTQASVERNFSTLEFVLNKRRNRLTEENLESVLFVKLNKGLFYEAFDCGAFTFE